MCDEIGVEKHRLKSMLLLGCTVLSKNIFDLIDKAPVLMAVGLDVCKFFKQPALLL